MNRISTYCLLPLFFILSCKKDEKFDLYNYEGEYPRSMDGSVIKTYTPEILGGTIEAKFNGHSWNHAPYLRIRAAEINSPFTKSGDQELNISIGSLLTNQPIESCVVESIFIQMPLKEGIYKLSDGYYEKGVGAVFRSVNCDVGKDEYQINLGKENWVNLKWYNKNTRELEAEFHLNFLIKVRNSNFGPIYPKEVKLTGSTKTVATLFD
jgi:hypothetical protein